MVIVNIEDFFHPNAGYQINILSKYLTKFGHKVYIVTSELDLIPDFLTSFFGKNNIDELDRKFEKNTGVKIIRLPVLKYISGRVIFKKNLISVIKKINPDIIYAHGNDTFNGINLIVNYKKNGIPLITDNHMLEMASKNPFNKIFRLFYRLFIKPIILKHNIKVIKTQKDDYVNRCLGIPNNLTPWISYGSDTMLFHPNLIVKQNFRKEYDILKDELVFVYTGKLDESKGGLLLANAIKNKIFAKKRPIFVIVGNAIGEYGKKVENLLSTSENRVIRFPTQHYEKLSYFYQIADIALFPKQCSLSFYDAQACGCPVLSENNNINIDRNSHNNGWTFEQNDVYDFIMKIRMICDMPDQLLDEVSNNALNFIKCNYNYEDKAREYEDIIIKEIYAKRKEK